MVSPVVVIAMRFFSEGERLALRQLQAEREIKAHHRAGLKQVRRENKRRPKRLNLGCGNYIKGVNTRMDD